MCRVASGHSTGSRASGPRASTSGSSWATATTRSPRWEARTWPASGSRTSSPRSFSAAASPPISSSRPATSPTTSRCPPATAAIATTGTSGSASHTGRRWTSCSRSTPRSLEAVPSWAAERWPRGEEPEAAWRRSIRAKALDLMRGLLPAATLSHVGVFASGQAYEQLLLRMAASPASRGARVRRDDPRGAGEGDPELRRPGRAPGSRRGMDRLPARAARGERAGRGEARARSPDDRRRAVGRADRRRREARRTCWPRRCSSPSAVGEAEIRRRIEALDPLERARADRRAGRRARATAATVRVAAGRRSATGSRSSPTTAGSATSSDTGC